LRCWIGERSCELTARGGGVGVRDFKGLAVGFQGFLTLRGGGSACAGRGAERPTLPALRAVWEGSRMTDKGGSQDRGAKIGARAAGFGAGLRREYL
jgi:hypothetical protein